MSHQLIDRNPDLKRLRDEGYNIGIKHGFLIIKDVPYVNQNAEVRVGVLISELNFGVGNVVVTPGSHQMYLAGEYPCHADGSRITQIEHSTPTSATLFISSFLVTITIPARLEAESK